MFDLDAFLRGVSSLVDDASRALRRIAPTALSPEKQFVNSTAGALALLVVSDGQIETDETLAAVQFIQALDPVVELNLQGAAIAFYEKYVEQQSAHFGNPPKLILEQAKILSEIAIIKGNAKYVSQVVAMCNSVVGANANDKERAMLAQIKSALGVA